MTEPTKLQRARWDNYVFDLERIAAALHCSGLTFRHYIEMATLAWSITGQQVDMTLHDTTKEERTKQ